MLGIFVDMLSILMHMELQSRILQVVCKAPTEHVHMYWSTFRDWGDWGPGGGIEGVGATEMGDVAK